MTKQVSIQHVQAGLIALYQTAVPDAAFVERLGQQFQGQRELPSSFGFTLRSRMRLISNWATALILVLVFIGLSVVAIGPQRVWAEVLGLISFIPGVGIAEVESTRLLVAPVTVRQEKVEFVVESVAVTDRTALKYTIRALPAMAPNPLERPIIMEGITFSLELPDGTIVSPTKDWTPTYASNYQLQSTVIFPRLPEGVEHVTLVLSIDREVALLPMDASELRLGIDLIAATDESVIERFPEPQILQGITDAQHGITMQVNKAFYVDGQIAVDVSFLNDSPWMLSWGRPQTLMFDDTPYAYRWDEIGLGIDATIPYRDPQHRIDMVYVFTPGLKPDASKLSFNIEAVLVYTDTAPLPIIWEIDTVPTSELYQTIMPLDIAFEINGYPYKIVSSYWDERPDFDPDWSPTSGGLFWDPQDYETEYLYIIDILAPSERQGDIQPAALVVESDHALYTNTLVIRGEERDTGVYDVYMLGFSDIPDADVRISVSKAYFLINDTWHVEWDVQQPDQ